VRRQTVAFLESLGEADWQRIGTTPTRGTLTIEAYTRYLVDQPAVADVGAVEQRRPVGLAGHGHCAGGRLGHWLEALVGAVWAVGAEALD